MSTPAGDILRGMEVERQPLRVGRVRAPLSRVQPAVAPAIAQADPAQVETWRRDAERAGYEEGHRKGLADASASAAAAVEEAVANALQPMQKRQEQIAELAASVAAARDDCLRAAEDDMVALCFETVCRIVAGSAVQPEAVRAQLRAHAARLAEDASTTLHVHPHDAELLQGEQGARQVRYVADSEVALGGCIVRQAGGGIDARLETMLAACKDALLSARRERGSGIRS